jgi:hypothetical protein
VATLLKIPSSRRSNPRSFLVAVGLKISEVSWVYILTIFIVVYATGQLGLPRTLLLNAIFVASLVEVVTIPPFGWLSDHVGRRVLYFLGTTGRMLSGSQLTHVLQRLDQSSLETLTPVLLDHLIVSASRREVVTTVRPSIGRGSGSPSGSGRACLRSGRRRCRRCAHQKTL